MFAHRFMACTCIDTMHKKSPEISMTKKSNSPTDARQDRDAKARGQKLGQQLKSLYKEVADEPVPDEFFMLLDQADQASKSDEADD